MEKYVIRHVDNGTAHYLVMFGYDGGTWRYEFGSCDLFRPVTLNDLHAAYTLVNLISVMYPWYAGTLDVQPVQLDG